MINDMKKKFIIYLVILSVLTIYILLDTFVIPKSKTIIEENNNVDLNIDCTSNDNEYLDDNISIYLDTKYEYNTKIYIADIKINNYEYLKRAFASNTYGKNIKDLTSNMAEDHNAILAINGDYYGFRSSGYVLGNGVLYRENGNNEALAILNDGSFKIINESDDNNLTDIWQILSFGPVLLNDSKVVVSETEEVSKAKLSNPRTAIGIIDNNHYIFIVSDGRSDESSGLSLYELASIMQSLGCKIAYNLDGGGSSTMYFNGKVINNPTDGMSNKERSVSDIVYIGY